MLPNLIVLSSVVALSGQFVLVVVVVLVFVAVVGEIR